MRDDDNILGEEEWRWISANQRRIGVLLLLIPSFFLMQAIANSSLSVCTSSIIKKEQLSPAIQKNQFSRTRPIKNPKDIVRFGDSIYVAGDWDMAPIVVEEFRLIFFTIPKVGCTVWKQLFRRMMGYDDWTSQDGNNFMPHNPAVNGLKYLHQYSIWQANMMMTSPNWTRAMFVRDPKERFVSAYLDKGQNKEYMEKKCCPDGGGCENTAAQSPEKFLLVARKCKNNHWFPQSTRIMEDKYWPYLNFIGHMEHVSVDARRLLERIGAWDGLGRRGWGKFGNESIFQPNSVTGRNHAHNAHDLIQKYITTADFEDQIEQFYLDDYYNPVLNLTMTRLHPPARDWDR